VGRIDRGGESSGPAGRGADGFPNAAGGLPDEGKSGAQHCPVGHGAAGRVCPNKSGLGLVKKCEERLGEGASLLVFPEGTRTVGGKLLPFKMGFALVAVLTRSPVQTVLITAGSNYLGKGWPLFPEAGFSRAVIPCDWAAVSAGAG
jgi:hypothetical protein